MAGELYRQGALFFGSFFWANKKNEQRLKATTLPTKQNPPLASSKCAERPKSPFAKGESRLSANQSGPKGGFRLENQIPGASLLIILPCFLQIDRKPSFLCYS